MTYKFKTGDTGLTRNGRPYRVIADDAKGDYPIVALICFDDGEKMSVLHLDGSCYRGAAESSADLMPPLQHRYINLYEGDDGVIRSGAVYSTRREADEGADKGRLGCIRVELVRGRFDD